MMNSRAAKLLLAIAVCAGLACGVPAGAQTLKTEPDANQLACGQKVLVENNTCLEVTVSCLRMTPAIDVVQTPRGTRYNCVKRSGSNPRVIR